MSLIQVHDVTRRFSDGAHVVTPLDGLDLTVAEGEFVCLMGPSGSGKTTLLNLIAGVDRPSSGSVQVAGRTISELGPRALARWRTRGVGYVFQQYNLIPVLTAFENV